MRLATSSGRSTVARELEDAILHLRANEAAIGVVLLRTDGNAQAVLEHDDFLGKANGDWLMREIRHYLKRVLKRIDVTPKSFVALIEPGSCFAGTLAELAFAADRSLHAGRHARRATTANRPRSRSARSISASIPWAMDLTRLQTRFLGEPESIEAAQGQNRRRRRGRRGRRAGAGDARLRGFRLGRRIARDAGRAHQLLARCHDRHGGKPALCRSGDHGNQDLRPPDRLAELDLPAAQRHRRAGRAQALRHAASSRRSTKRGSRP